MDRYIEWNWLTQPPLGFPRGEAAERSEADEGRRQIGSQMQLDEWYLLRFLPFNVESSNFLAIATPHQSALPVPKSRHGCQLPPGEAKNSEDFGDNHSTNRSIAWASGRQVGDPYGTQKNFCLQQPKYYTPSVSPFWLTAPPEVEPRRLRRSGRQVGDPYKSGTKIHRF